MNHWEEVGERASAPRITLGEFRTRDRLGAAFRMTVSLLVTGAGDFYAHQHQAEPHAGGHEDR